MNFNLFNGDCLDFLKTLPDNSVDSIVTDPPYGLSNQSQDDIVKCLTAWLADEAYTHGNNGFMGNKWDSFVPSPTIWKECLRVLKHGGYIACFAGSRTQDLMGMSLRLAGFELKETIMWVYASGFPKGLNIAKGIDVAKGELLSGNNSMSGGNYTRLTHELQTDEAKQWEGWNTQLKPAYESIILARKPLDGTVVNNVLKHGVGGLNIDACRVGIEIVKTREKKKGESFTSVGNGSGFNGCGEETRIGRYPANLIHDGSEEATGGMPWSKSGSGQKNQFNNKNTACSFSKSMKSIKKYFNGSEGSDSRYFYCAKASKADRDEGLDGFELKRNSNYNSIQRASEKSYYSNFHPTVKPTALMQYVTKLITPLNGTVLDPFMGSGSTGKACMLEGFNFTGIELNPEYITIAEARIKHAQSLASRKQLKLDV